MRGATTDYVSGYGTSSRSGSRRTCTAKQREGERAQIIRYALIIQWFKMGIS